MNLDRRAFLEGALGAGIGASLAPALTARTTHRKEPLKLLIIGGTGFLGPAIVEHARARGHTVTLFNRGKTEPTLFPDVPRIIGDRNVDADLAKLEAGTWDAVIDTSAYFPKQVMALCAKVAPRVPHYVFVSTVSVYDVEQGDFDENTPVGKYDGDANAVASMKQVTGQAYGPLKAACEAAAEAAMPGKVCNIRPGLIIGPRDNSDRFTYWPMRVARGGDVLAPGDPDAELQMIDVRDLGEWIVHCCEQKVCGVYNAVGFKGRISFQEMLHGCKVVLGTDCTFTWVDGEFLGANGVKPWAGKDSMPLWAPGRSHFANARAQAAGLTFRPLAETIKATVDWCNEAKHVVRGGGVSPETEQKVLAAWRTREAAPK